MNDNLYALFRARFLRDPNAAAIVPRRGETLTYGALDGLSARIATLLLAKGAAPGDRVAVQVEKSAMAVALYLGCLRAGLVYLPMNTAYRDDELDYFIGDAEPSVIVGDPSSTVMPALGVKYAAKTFLTLDAAGGGTLADQLRDAEPRAHIHPNKAQDLAAILYSSGTTGKPKGVMLSHGNLAANAVTLHRLWQFGPGDVLLHALPIYHTHGLFVALNTTFLNGTPLLLHDKFAAEDVIADLPRATVFMGVPTYYVRLLGSPKFTREVCANMRLFISGSAPLLSETFETFVHRTGMQILERYGMTEAGMITSALPGKPRRAGTVGWPLPDVTLRLNPDSHEIEIKGPNVFGGYWRKPDRTAADFTDDGFFKTGDIGRIEDDDMIAIVGRAKDMIISGGFNVYPKEIETCIDALPGVEESAVVGLPHPEFGEAGLAIIAMKPRAAALTDRDVLSVLKEQLANYKVPKMVVFAALPRNAMGKVQKNVLREQYRESWTAAMTRQ